MNDAPKAVFLSYASQDTEAVLRIAEALRAAGIEVWRSIGTRSSAAMRGLRRSGRRSPSAL